MPGPATDANRRRNARGRRERRDRWTPARDALWALLDPYVEVGARVAIVGAGNGDDLPLRRLTARAEVTLLDLDRRAAVRTRRGLGREAARRVTVIEHDVTGGAADAITAAARHGDGGGGRGLGAGGDGGRRATGGGGPGRRQAGGGGQPGVTLAPAEPLPGAPYDLVVGDLLYSQLLYPALLDLGVPGARLRATLRRHGAGLTRSVVARMHASAPTVAHVHDLVGWWAGHPQPVALETILAAPAATDALRLAARCTGPPEADPRTALAALGLPFAATALWRWPFAEAVDYLVCATIVERPGRP